MINNFFHVASKVYRELKAQGANPTWPLPKKVVEDYLSTGSFTTPFNRKANRSTTRGDLFREAKSLGYEGRYNTSTNEVLRNFIQSPEKKFIDSYINFLNNASLIFNFTEATKQYLFKAIALTPIFKEPFRFKLVINQEIENQEPKIISRVINDNFKSFAESNNLNDVLFGNVASSVNYDYDIFQELENAISSYQIEKYIPINEKKINEGGFFPYRLKESNHPTHDTLLSTYERYVSPKQDDDCFGYCLNLIHPMLYQRYKCLRIFSADTKVSLSHLPIIAKELGINIIVKYYKKKQDNGTYIKNYNDDSSKKLNLFLYKNHYFIDETTTITKQDIFEVYSIKMRARTGFLSSHKFMDILYKNNLLEEYSPASFLEFSKTNIDKIRIDGSSEDLLSGFIEPTDDPKYKTYDHLPSNPIIYFDFETFAAKGTTHKPYMLAAYFDDKQHAKSPIKVFCGDDCSRNFLSYVKNEYPKQTKLTLVAHNLGYDLSFFIGLKGFNLSSRIGNSCSKTKAATAYYFGLKLKFQDSYAFISTPLREFTSYFKLDASLYAKGIFPYDATKPRRINTNSCLISKALPHINEKDLPEFLNILKKYAIPNGKDEPKKFRITDMAKDYCIDDVKLLREGFTKFRYYIYELTKFDVLDYVSSPGLSLAVVHTYHTLDKVPELKGSSRHFISQTIVGGRNCTANNLPQEINEPLEDLDVVSLYPTAMAMIDNIPLAGTERLIFSDNELYEDTVMLDKYYSWYFLEIEILSVRKKYSIPSLSYKQTDGVLEWSDKPGTYFLNHIQLQDACKFQKIIYKNKGGIGFIHSKHQADLSKPIHKLFEQRQFYKQQGSPMQNVIKLILNSIYGKTLQSPITSQEKTFSDIDEPFNAKKLEEFIERNFSSITYIEYFKRNGLNHATVLFRKAAYNHHSYIHLASVILALSKRIMNQYIYTALDNKIRVLYTDTDSMFIPQRSVERFCQKYKKAYGKHPLGNNLGDLQSDYTKAVPPKSTNIVADSAFFVTKKMYSVSLSYELNGKTHHTYVTKIKGIPTKAIDYLAKSLNITTFDLIKLISYGNQIRFDLMADRGVHFECKHDFIFSTPTDFIRYVSYPSRDPPEKELQTPDILILNVEGEDITSEIHDIE